MVLLWEKVPKIFSTKAGLTPSLQTYLTVIFPKYFSLAHSFKFKLILV